MLSINTNVSANFAFRQGGLHRSRASVALQRLSSGLKINSAKDDPSGLAMSQKMRAQLTRLEQDERNKLDELSKLETQDGTLSGIHDMMNRMSELAARAATGTISDSDRKNIDAEYQELLKEIGRQKETKYNGVNLFSSSSSSSSSKDSNKIVISGGNLDAYLDELNVFLGKVSDAAAKKDETALGELGLSGTAGLSDKDRLQQAVVSFTEKNASRLLNKEGAGASDSYTLTIENGNVKVDGSGNGGLYGLEGSSLATVEDALATMDKIKTAINRVSSERGDYGAKMSRMEYSLNNISNMQVNLADALSRIQDADMAKEMMNWVRENALAQSADFVMAQAMQAPKNALSLLQSML